MTLVDSVTNQTVGHTTSADGHTFTYYLNGPVTLATAGDYHFVVEAQAAADDPDAGTEDKDADKWAVEQNSRFVSPPFVTFGATNSGTNEAGVPANLDTTSIAQTAGTAFLKMGYGRPGANTSASSSWWTPSVSGVTLEADAADAVGPKNSPSLPVAPLTAQYNAVWAFIGHGSGPSNFTGRKFKFQQMNGGESNSYVFSSSAVAPDTPSRTFLDKLPFAYQQSIRHLKRHLWLPCSTAASCFSQDAGQRIRALATICLRLR